MYIFIFPNFVVYFATKLWVVSWKKKVINLIESKDKLLNLEKSAYVFATLEAEKENLTQDVMVI